MKKLVAAVVVIILAILPSTARASSLGITGKCTIEDGKVTLFGEVFGYEYGYDYPMEWEFLTKSVDSDRWRSLMFEGSYRQSLTMQGGNYWFRFKSDPMRTEARVYRLDLRTDVGQGREETWVPKVVYYNDSRPRSVERCNRHFEA
jgi:hypothetical protein